MAIALIDLIILEPVFFTVANNVIFPEAHVLMSIYVAGKYRPKYNIEKLATDVIQPFHFNFYLCYLLLHPPTKLIMNLCIIKFGQKLFPLEYM